MSESFAGPLVHQLFLFAADATSTPRSADVETLGPISMPRERWQLIQHAGSTLVAIVIAVVLLRLVPMLERLVIRLATRYDGHRSATATGVEFRQRIETLTRVTSSIATAVIWTTTIIVVLGDLGIAVGPLLATAGIAGVAIGFGAQSILKDFFAGFFILLESQFDVGDVVTIGGLTGTVERMTMRITVLRDVNGTVYFIPNSGIANVANRTHGWGRAVVDVSFASSVPEADAQRLLLDAASEATEKLRDEPVLIDEITVEGPVEFEAGGLKWRLAAKTRPERMVEARAAMISALGRGIRERGFAVNGSLIARG